MTRTPVKHRKAKPEEATNPTLSDFMDRRDKRTPKAFFFFFFLGGGGGPGGVTLDPMAMKPEMLSLVPGPRPPPIQLPTERRDESEKSSPEHSQEPRGGERHWRLLDVNLIIIGSGPQAERLLQRRLRAGGRACLLWTRVPPESSPSVTVSHDQVPFKQETFTWLPPPRTREGSCPEILRLQRRFGSADYGFMRAGPEVVALSEGEHYELVLEGRSCVGVRVLRAGAVSWQLSGAVLPVGPWDGQCPQSQPSSREAWELTIDVGVQQEEAKPQMYIDGGGPLVTAVSAAYFVLVHVCTYIFLNMHESHVLPEDVDWWWQLPRTMTVTGQLWSQQLADGLLGYPIRRSVAVIMILAGALVWSFFEFAFLLQRSGWRLQYFVMTCIGFEMSSVTQLLLCLCVKRCGRISPWLMNRAQDTKRQALWTAFLWLMNMLLLFAQWIIIMVYVFLDSVSTILAASS